MTKKTVLGDSNRRAFLKTLAVGSAGISIPTTAAARNRRGNGGRSEQRRYEAISKNRDKMTEEQFHRKLRNAGFDVYSTEYNYRVSADGKNVSQIDGEMSAQHLAESDLTATVSLFEGWLDSFADLRWTVDTGWWEQGADPRDNLTLAWSDNQYLLSGVDSGSSSGSVDLRERDANGVIWGWDDDVVSSNDEESGWVTAYLQQQDDCHTRRIYGTYEHTWDEVTIQSIVIGAGGVSIVYSDEDKMWKVFPQDSFGGSC